MENTTLNFDNYLFRCSSLGKLLTEPQSKVDKDAGNLSKTTESYLKELHKEVIFKRRKTISSKYLEKGIVKEETSLTAYSTYLGKPFFKNEKFFKNDFICGTPDNCTDKVRDIKTSWDYSTFPLYDKEIKNADYVAQLNGYMELTGLKSAELIYCLVDTPFKQINDEIRKLDWKYSVLDGNGDIIKDFIPLIVETVQNMIYTQKGLEDFCLESPIVELHWFEDFREIPKNLRVKVFQIKKDDALIEKIKSRIIKAREYMSELSIDLCEVIL